MKLTLADHQPPEMASSSDKPAGFAVLSSASTGSGFSCSTCIGILELVHTSCSFITRLQPCPLYDVFPVVRPNAIAVTAHATTKSVQAGSRSNTVPAKLQGTLQCTHKELQLVSCESQMGTSCSVGFLQKRVVTPGALVCMQAVTLGITGFDSSS